MKFGYLSRLEGDLQRWVTAGMIGESAAHAMLTDARGRGGAYSFATIIVFLGMVSLALGAMTFVAANWQAMPRLMKVGLLLAAMWAALAGAAFANHRERPALADSLVMLGTAIFGAAVMLVGQIYHLQGRAADAVLLWAAGSAVATALLRSRGALWLTIVLITVWLVMRTIPEFGADAPINLLYPVFWLGAAALAWWLRSRLAAHLLAVGAIVWIAATVGILTEREENLTLAAATYAGMFLLAGAALLAQKRGGRLRDVGALALGYVVISIIAMTGLWIAARAFGEGEAERMAGSISEPAIAVILAATAALAAFAYARARDLVYDLSFCALWTAITLLAVTEPGRQIPFLAEAFALALSIWFIRMGGRHDVPGVTRLGYLAFALVMGLIYFRTAGTLLGTSGFYLAAGLALVLGAVFVPRLLRKRKSEAGEVS